jgi:hypothetical protein
LERLSKNLNYVEKYILFLVSYSFRLLRDFGGRKKIKFEHFYVHQKSLMPVKSLGKMYRAHQEKTYFGILKAGTETHTVLCPKDRSFLPWDV